jgi:hypothetical protein
MGHLSDFRSLHLRISNEPVFSTVSKNRDYRQYKEIVGVRPFIRFLKTAYHRVFGTSWFQTVLKSLINGLTLVIGKDRGFIYHHSSRFFLNVFFSCDVCTIIANISNNLHIRTRVFKL